MHSRIQNILSPEFQKFLQENQHLDPHELLLKKNSPVDVREVTDQLLSKRKAQSKLPEWVNQRGIVFPPPLSVEQSSSATTARYKQELITGDHLVDLTGGMGVDCLYMSQQFTKTTYIEQDSWLCALFKHNHPLLTNRGIMIENGSAENFLNQFPQRATFFIDPARRDAKKQKVFRFADCSPHLIELMPVLREKGERLLVKAAPLIDLTQGIKELGGVTEIHVVSVRNEVKEVLFLLDFVSGALSENPKIACVNLESVHSVFHFHPEEERKIEIPFNSIQKYLYDPNAAILKASAFKSIAQAYLLQKLAPNTHLYTSDELIPDFPGRTFEVLSINPGKKELKELLPNQKANVLTKNYPLSPEGLKTKLKLKDGGDFFLIGYRDMTNRPQVVVSKLSRRSTQVK